MKIYIYAIWFPTSKKYYIGQTRNLKSRLEGHFISGSLVCKALWKYDNWQVSILHTIEDQNNANLMEIEDIRNFNSVAPNGYNLTRGGDGIDGYHHTKEAKKKIGNANKGNTNMRGKKNPAVSESNKRRKGYKHSKETKEKIGAGNRGKIVSKKARIKIAIARIKYSLKKLGIENE